MVYKLLELITSKIKIIKLAKILRINPKFFFDTTIFHISKLFKAKVDNKLIIFGSNSGKAFIGNPKYLFEYLKKNSNYKLYFCAKSESLRKKLEKEGINTINIHSLEAIKLLRKARAVFVSHGYEDILPIKFSPKSLVIYTGHGGGIKIKGKSPYHQKYLNSKWAKVLRVKLRDDDIYSYIVSPSGSEKPLKITSSMFKYPLDKIISTGYPRNDILFAADPSLKIKFKNFYKIPKEIQRIILYAPTYREIFSTKGPFTKEDLIKLNEFCKENNTVLLIKGHFKEEIIEFKNLENIKEVRKDSDTQELLFITDILITDYSTIFHDFLLLNRPILLYTYDYDEYVSKRGIYYDSLEEIAPGPFVYNINDLIEALKNIAEIKTEYENKRIKLRNYFNKFNDGNSSERLLRYLRLID
jgi:CDP-glycerol glycerophosphotransferase